MTEGCACSRCGKGCPPTFEGDHVASVVLCWKCRARPTITPSAGRILIRPVQTPETLGGGRIILTEATREDWTWGQMEVVQVGAPAYCEDEDCERLHVAECGDHGEELERRHPVDIQVGDWILIQHRAASETHTEGLYVCSVDDVLAKLER